MGLYSISQGGGGGKGGEGEGGTSGGEESRKVICDGGDGRTASGGSQGVVDGIADEGRLLTSPWGFRRGPMSQQSTVNNKQLTVPSQINKSIPMDMQSRNMNTFETLD